MNTVLEVYDLTKTYKGFHANDHISLRIPKGSIFGLVGPNGSGKSTLMKIVGGLAYPSGGSIKLFEQDPKQDSMVYRRIGTLIENAGFYPSMNAYDNMKLKSLAMGCFQENRNKELLKVCDIHTTGKKKVKHFSLGMKQRLGIAMALLGEPEFLILDEPTNGLDPQGISDIRTLLLKLNKERGMTILISSHILEELGKIATHYAFIKQGKLLECITKEELQEKSKDFCCLKVNDTQRASVILEEICGITSYEVLPQQCIHIYKSYEYPQQIAKALIQQDVELYEMSVHKQSLEEYFLKESGDQHVE